MYKELQLLKYKHYSEDTIEKIKKHLSLMGNNNNYYYVSDKEKNDKLIDIFIRCNLYLLDNIDRENNLYLNTYYESNKILSRSEYNEISKTKKSIRYIQEEPIPVNKMTEEMLLVAFERFKISGLWTSELFIKLMSDLGYKLAEKDKNKQNADNIFGNKTNTKVVSLVKIFFKLDRYYLDIDRILAETNQYEKYPDFIYSIYSGEINIWQYMRDKLEQDISNEEKIAIYSAYFKNVVSGNKEFETFAQRDLNNSTIMEAFTKSRVKSMKTFAEMYSGNNKTELNNIVKNKYSCVVSFNYQRFRAQLPIKNKSTITNILQTFTKKTQYSVGYKADEMTTIIVMTEFPIENKTLEDFIANNILRWIQIKCDWQEEVSLFVAKEREKLLRDKIIKEEDVKDKTDGKIKKKI